MVTFQIILLNQKRCLENVHVPPCCFCHQPELYTRYGTGLKKSQIQTEKLPHKILKLSCGSSWQRLNPLHSLLSLNFHIKSKFQRWWNCYWLKGILSQCIYVSNYHVLHFKYLTILFVNCTSIKLKNKEEKGFKKGFKKEANWENEKKKTTVNPRDSSHDLFKISKPLFCHVCYYTST